MFHWLPVKELRKIIRFPDAPVNVNVPVIVCVVPAVKVICFPAVVEVKLLNVAEPDIVETFVLSLKITVPVPALKVPELDQLPPTVIELLPAESVPADIVRLLETITSPASVAIWPAILIFKFPYVIALTVCADAPAYSTVRLVKVLLVIVYCELKSAVASVRVTLTVPLPVNVPMPLITSVAEGVNKPQSCLNLLRKRRWLWSSY